VPRGEEVSTTATGGVGLVTPGTKADDVAQMRARGAPPSVLVDRTLLVWLRSNLPSGDQIEP
jgi:hypothetical protein